jgi:uncharacterized protein YyaL (SSP411 family)
MPNRLAQETSPYLQQHADNPVDWYPWGEEALQRARDEGKPILLSVGYSACHWCHVMAHESFEDPQIAAQMNRDFVNIKVDREERPDIDQIYQQAQHMLSQRPGGWPLTMFLTPDQRPFFGGTYFPKSSRYNLPGFGELLAKIASVYREQPQAIAAQNEELAGLLQRQTAPPSPALEMDAAPIEAALAELARMFDSVHGGLGGAPKFPHPAELELCLSQGAAGGDSSTGHVALYTLRKMAEGGIYDQLGGGFCRYSVDQRWNIPHFEKMLYDNGPLLFLYADAWLVTRDPLFARVCEETAQWVLREMQSPEGGYYSSLDADSEHEEGKFYVWSREEVSALLTEDELAVANRHFGVDQAPNFEDVRWHLFVAQPLDQVAAELKMGLPQAQQLLQHARRKLFDAREQRVRPGRDEKILTSWNALMIRGMAHAGRIFGRTEWVDSALRAMDFLRGSLYVNRRLLATYKDGRAHLNAYLDDHAFLLAALIELIQSRFRIEELNFAQELADALIARFEDTDAGGFFFTSSDHEVLIARLKPGPDNATPSGNGIAALSLQRLGHLVGETRYLSAAERALRAFYPQMQQHASAFATICMALGEYMAPPASVILRGDGDDLHVWSQAMSSAYRPGMIVIALRDGLPELPQTMDKPRREGVNAWVCRGVSCLPPIGDRNELEAVLRGA